MIEAEAIILCYKLATHWLALVTNESRSAVVAAVVMLLLWFKAAQNVLIVVIDVVTAFVAVDDDKLSVGVKIAKISIAAVIRASWD